MKGKKLITLSLITISLLLNGCNKEAKEDNYTNYGHCVLNNTNLITYTENFVRSGIDCEILRGAETLTENQKENNTIDLSTYIKGECVLDTNNYINITDNLLSNGLTCMTIKEAMGIITLTEETNITISDKAISPLVVQGKTTEETKEVNVIIYDNTGKEINNILATLNNSFWTAETDKLGNGDYNIKVISTNYDLTTETLTKDKYEILTYNINIDNIDSKIDIPYTFKGYHNGDIERAFIEVVSNTEFVLTSKIEGNTIIQRQSNKVIERIEVNLSDNNTWYASTIKGSEDYKKDLHFIRLTAYSKTSLNEDNKITTVRTSNLFNVNEEIINTTEDITIKINGNSETGTFINGIVSDTVSNIKLDIKDLDNNIIDTQNILINEDKRYISNYINLENGNYKYNFTLEKLEGGEVLISGDFEVDNNLLIIIDNIENQKVGSFLISGLVDTKSIKTEIELVNLDTNEITLLTPIVDKFYYSIMTNDLIEGNYTARGRAEDTQGNIVYTNTINFNIRFDNTIFCLEEPIDSIITINNVEYLVVDNETIINVVNGESEVLKSNGEPFTAESVCTSNVSDMSYLFEDTDFNGNINTWDTSNVENMEGMFSGSSFNSDISNWNVSNVENMEGMFASSLNDESLRSLFNQDISMWNTSNVSNMNYLFYENSSFNQDLSIWNIDNVECNYTDFDYEAIIWEDINKPLFNTDCVNDRVILD